MTIYLANPGDNLVAKANALIAGDTLILNDGTYVVTAANNGLIISGIHGASGNPIIIKAANDGKAIIDGQNGTAGAYEPIFLTNSSYITMQGLVCQNSYGSVVKLYGSTNGGGPVDHITLQRMTGHGTGDENHHVFNVSFNCTNILVEDCAAWGRGRYMFIAYHCDTVTFRRCFAYWNQINNTQNQPRAGFSIYGSKNVIEENCISRHAYPQAGNTGDIYDSNYYAGLWHDSDDKVNFPTDNVQHYGSIFYNDYEAFHANENVGTGLFVKDCYFESPSIATGLTTKPGGSGYWSDDKNPSTITNCTFRSSVVGFITNSGPAPTITNSVFASNVSATSGANTHSYCDFFQNGNDATLTLYGSDSSDATLTQAGRFSATTTQAESLVSATTNGTPTSGWIEVHAGTGQTPQASIPGTPSSKGFIYQTTLLEGQTIPTGNWSVVWTASTASLGGQSLAATMRFFKRSSGGAYTSIGSIQINDTFAANGVKKPFFFPSTSLPSMAFAVGDRLYIDLWVSATWGASGNGCITALASTGVAGIPNDLQVTTPGYLATGGGTTSLVLYGSTVADSGTLATALQLDSSTGGTESSWSQSSATATSGAWIEAHGGTNQTPLVSIPDTPSSAGWIYDHADLDGATVLSGNWLGAVSFSTTSNVGKTFSATLRAFKRSSVGTYTPIGAIPITGQTFGSSGTHVSFSFPSTSFSSMAFATGDRLYIDLWVFSNWGASTGFTQYLSQSTVFGGVAGDLQITTPGYVPSANATALIVYGSNNTDATLTTAADLSNTTTQTETNPSDSSAIAATGWIEAHGKTGQTPQASIPATPSGKGWIYDDVTLEGKTVKSGNWSALWTISTASMAAHAFSATMRFWKYSAGTYTSIGTIPITSQTFGSSGAHTTYTFPITSLSSMTFAVGDRLYIDLWVSATWGASSGYSEYLSTSGLVGVAGDLQITTPGYTPTVGATDVAVDPGWSTATYGGRGGTLFIPSTSPLKGAGSSGSGDIGANILYQYVNATLTSTPLWPWPMEDRVVAELSISPTYETGDGLGLWKTLSGLYTAFALATTSDQVTAIAAVSDQAVSLTSVGDTAVARAIVSEE